MSKSIVRARAGAVKPPESRELEEFVRMVLATMRARGELHGDEEDAFQWAALAVWEGVVLRGVPLCAGNRVYHFKAARLKVIYQGRRAACAASVYDRFAREAPVGYMPLIGCGHVALKGGKSAARDNANVDPRSDPIDISGGDDPTARRAAADARAARAEVGRLVRSHLCALPERQRRGLEVALSRDSETPISDAAWITGNSSVGLSAALHRLGQRVRADRGAVRARRKLAELAA